LCFLYKTDGWYHTVCGKGIYWCLIRKGFLIEVTLIYSRPSNLSSKKQKNEKYRRGKEIYIYFFFLSNIFVLFGEGGKKKKQKKTKTKKPRHFFLLLFFCFYYLPCSQNLLIKQKNKNKMEFHIYLFIFLFYGEGKKQKTKIFFFVFVFVFSHPVLKLLLLSTDVLRGFLRHSSAFRTTTFIKSAVSKTCFS